MFFASIRFRLIFSIWKDRELTYLQNELLLEAIEHLAGGHLDDVNNTKINNLWTRAKAYIKEHGGETTAGPSTIKKKYKALSESVPEIRRDLKPGKAKWDHKAYEKYKVRGQDEASFDNEVKRNKSTGKPGGRSSQNNSDTKYDVEHEEGADSGETDDDEEEEEEGHEEADKDYKDDEDENSGA